MSLVKVDNQQKSLATSIKKEKEISIFKWTSDTAVSVRCSPFHPRFRQMNSVSPQEHVCRKDCIALCVCVTDTVRQLVERSPGEWTARIEYKLVNCDFAFKLLDTAALHSQQKHSCCTAEMPFTTSPSLFVLLTFVHFLIAYYIPFRQCTLVLSFW